MNRGVLCRPPNIRSVRLSGFDARDGYTKYGSTISI